MKYPRIYLRRCLTEMENGHVLKRLLEGEPGQIIPPGTVRRFHGDTYYLKNKVRLGSSGVAPGIFFKARP